MDPPLRASPWPQRKNSGRSSAFAMGHLHEFTASLARTKGAYTKEGDRPVI